MKLVGIASGLEKPQLLRQTASNPSTVGQTPARPFGYSTQDSFSRESKPSSAQSVQKLGNRGHTVDILEFQAGMLEKRGEHQKADDLRSIAKVYAEVGKKENGRGNCSTATSAIMDGMKERFKGDGPSAWKVETVGVGKAKDGSYVHQAVAILDRETGKPVFALDPTRMDALSMPWLGLARQGNTDAYGQAYYFDEFLRTRQNNYGPGFELGVPAGRLKVPRFQKH